MKTSQKPLAYLLVRQGRYMLPKGTAGLRKLAVPDRCSVLPPDTDHEVVVGQVVHDTAPTDPCRGVAFVRVWHDENSCQTCRNLAEHAAWASRLEEAGRFLQATIGATTMPWMAPEPIQAAARRLADADPAVRAQAQATIRVHADQLRYLYSLQRRDTELIRQIEAASATATTAADAAWMAEHAAALAAAEARCADASTKREAAQARLEQAGIPAEWTVHLGCDRRWLARWTPSSGVREVVQTWERYRVWVEESPDGYRPAGSFETTGWVDHPVPADRPAPIPAPEEVAAWATPRQATYQAALAEAEAATSAYRAARAERDQLVEARDAARRVSAAAAAAPYEAAMQALREEIAKAVKELEE